MVFKSQYKNLKYAIMQQIDIDQNHYNNLIFKYKNIFTKKLNPF
jgi:hypothetical protein